MLLQDFYYIFNIKLYKSIILDHFYLWLFQKLCLRIFQILLIGMIFYKNQLILIRFHNYQDLLQEFFRIIQQLYYFNLFTTLIQPWSKMQNQTLDLILITFNINFHIKIYHLIINIFLISILKFFLNQKYFLKLRLMFLKPPQNFSHFLTYNLLTQYLIQHNIFSPLQYSRPLI